MKLILSLLITTVLAGCSSTVLPPLQYRDPRCTPGQWCIYTDPPSPIIQRGSGSDFPEYQGQRLRMPGGEVNPPAWKYR